MISFIIPAYNAENTIKRTINSILGQTENELEYEIIIVNDGSTDKTEEQLEEYFKYKNLMYVKTENGGLSRARNIGFEKSKGEYIIFIDSDDYIEKNLLKDIEPFIKKDIDLIKWWPQSVDESGHILNKNKMTKFETISGEKAFNILYGKDPLISCVWDYAIKRNLVRKFPEGKYHEDFATTPLLMLNAKSVVSIDKYEYNYVQSSNSIMRNSDEKKSRKKIEDLLFHYDNILAEIDNMNIEKRTKENMKIFGTYSLIIVVSELKGQNKKWYIRELKKRKIAKNIKIRNFKQLVKRLILEIKY